MTNPYRAPYVLPPSIQPGPVNHVLSLVNDETDWISGTPNVASSGTPGFLVDDGTDVNRRDIELNDLQEMGQAEPSGALTNTNGTVAFTTGNDGDVLTTVNTVNGLETSWAPSAAGTSIYSADGTIAADRTVDVNDTDLIFSNVGTGSVGINRNDGADINIFSVDGSGVSMESNEVSTSDKSEVVVSAAGVLLQDTSSANTSPSILVDGGLPAVAPNVTNGGIQINASNLQLMQTLIQDNAEGSIVTVGANGLLKRRDINSFPRGRPVDSYKRNGTAAAVNNSRLTFPVQLLNQMGSTNVAGLISNLSGVIEIFFTCSVNTVDPGDSITITLRDNGAPIASAVRSNSGAGGTANYQVYLTALITDPPNVDVYVSNLVGAVETSEATIKFKQF